MRDNIRSNSWVSSWRTFFRGDEDGKPEGTWIVNGKEGAKVGFVADEATLKFHFGNDNTWARNSGSTIDE